MTEKEAEPFSEEADFNRAMRALIRVSKSEIEELEKQEAKVRAESANKKRRKVRNQAA